MTSKMHQRVIDRRKAKEVAARHNVNLDDRFLCLTCKRNIELEIRNTLKGGDDLQYWKKEDGELVGFYCSSECSHC